MDDCGHVGSDKLGGSLGRSGAGQEAIVKISIEQMIKILDVVGSDSYIGDEKDALLYELSDKEKVGGFISLERISGVLGRNTHEIQEAIWDILSLGREDIEFVLRFIRRKYVGGLCDAEDFRISDEKKLGSNFVSIVDSIQSSKLLGNDVAKKLIGDGHRDLVYKYMGSFSGLSVDVAREIVSQGGKIDFTMFDRFDGSDGFWSRVIKNKFFFSEDINTSNLSMLLDIVDEIPVSVVGKFIYRIGMLKIDWSSVSIDTLRSFADSLAKIKKDHEDIGVYREMGIKEIWKKVFAHHVQHFSNSGSDMDERYVFETVSPKYKLEETNPGMYELLKYLENQGERGAFYLCFNPDESGGVKYGPNGKERL